MKDRSTTSPWRKWTLAAAMTAILGGWPGGQTMGQPPATPSPLPGNSPRPGASPLPASPLGPGGTSPAVPGQAGLGSPTPGTSRAPNPTPSTGAAPSTAAFAAAASAPNMIGDFFGGIGSCGNQPVFIGQSIFHSANSPLGGNDFHLITPGNPATFQGGAAGGTGVAFGGDPNNLVGFGRPGQAFVAVPTGTVVNVNDPAELQGEFDNAQVFNIFTAASSDVCVPSPGAGGGVGRVKLAENTSPLPRDRVFMNYSYFDNVALTEGGVNVNRFTPGLEKTFLGGITSVEVRVPFASTIDSNLLTGGLTDTSNLEFGNLSVVSKTLLWQDDRWAFSGGIQVALPTADDVTVSTPFGTQLIHVENDAVHLMPFVGALYTPNDRFFAQGFLQVDTDANDNPVAIRDPFTGSLAGAGEIDDTDFLYLNLSMGYWLHRSNCRCARVTGIAPIFEVHYNGSLEDTDSVAQSGLRVGHFADDIDLVNLVFGGLVEWGGNSSLYTAFVTPVAGGADKDFDGELRIIFNHRFGPQSRASRAQL